MPAVSPAMVAIAAAVLVTFIGGLYFHITTIRKKSPKRYKTRKSPAMGFRQKPEERWRYIKELESRQPGVRTPTEPSAGAAKS